MSDIRQQLRHHAVALISLTVAITGLAYNSYRNELSEANRNVRTAGIEMLIKLGELDRTLLHAQWGMPGQSGDETFMHVRSGWAYVLTIRDLSALLPEPASSSANRLSNAWDALSSQLGGDDQTAFDAISQGIDATRRDVLEVLATLD